MKRARASSRPRAAACDVGRWPFCDSRFVDEAFRTKLPCLIQHIRLSDDPLLDPRKRMFAPQQIALAHQHLRATGWLDPVADPA